MLRYLSFSILLLLSSSLLRAQPWVELLMDGETNLFDVKAAFDDTWQGRNYVRGQGYKQFHRWYWFMEQRTWPSGDRPDPAIYLEAMHQVEAMRVSKSGSRDNSIWEPLGPTNWTSISYNPGNGRVNAIAVDPLDSTIIYAGTPSSGLWRSTDDGNTWVPLFTDLPSMGISAIAIHPTSPDTIFIATGDGDGEDTYSAGVLRSNDGGATWDTTGLNWNIAQTRTTRALRMDPNDPQRMYCATSHGLFSTTDGAVTWSLHENGSFKDVEFKPGDSSVVYACTDRFYRSVDGITFTTPSAGLPPASAVGRMAIAVTPADPLTVYVLVSSEEDNSFMGLYHSGDGGNTFQMRSNWPNLFTYGEYGDGAGGQAWYDMALAVDPIDAYVVYVGGINVWKSTDAGLSWAIRSHWIYPSAIGYTHADIHFLEVINNRVYCGSDGGVFLSEDAGQIWQDRSAGLEITQFYRLGGSELIPDLVMAGAQDNGSNQFVDPDWIHVYGGDGMEAAIDPFDPSVIYASTQRGGLMRSDDGGFTFMDIAQDIYEEGAWVTPFVLDPLQPMNVLAGYNNLWHSGYMGEYWDQITFWDNDEFVRCIAYAPMNSDIIYVARNDLVQRSLDGGSTWDNIRPGLPTLSPTSIAVDHLDPLHVWITFSGDNEGQKVYESLNGGQNWVNRSAGLPNIPVNSIVIQPYSADAVYIGTDMGVFYMDDIDPQWQLFGEGLPNVVVSELEINIATNKLRAATFGRGIWQADLQPSINVAIAENYAPAPTLAALDHEGRFTIGMIDANNKLLQVQVHDAMGRTILTNSGSSDLIDLSRFAKGSYSVTIITSQGKWVRRVLR